MKRTTLLLLAMLAASGRACFNDRDTLGFELRDQPDAQRALTGRFERNPPLYYRMRVARLRSRPRLTAAEHDDLAVALGRLGREDEALASLDPKGLRTADDRYRFFANRGTLRAHRWLRHGADRSAKSDLSLAADDIARALKINPNAHFGREATQLEVIRWLMRPKDDDSLGEWLEGKKGPDPMLGLEGLIMLGGAWESPDVAYAIARLAGDQQEFSTAELAYARYGELRAWAGRPLRPDDIKEDRFPIGLGKRPPDGEPPVAESFRRLRTEAEAWNRSRTLFMLARLEQGRHPDTDLTFWKGWRDTPMPRLDPTRRMTHSEVQARWIVATFYAVGAGFLALVVLGLALIVRATRRRRLPGA